MVLARRKVVFVIVEGPSDSEALGLILNEFFSPDDVYLHIEHTDITTVKGHTAANITTKIGNLIRSYAKNNHYDASHFRRVIHIVDTDGAYVTDESILEDASLEKPVYTGTTITCKDRAQLIARNRQKSGILNRLHSTQVVFRSVPYSVYYMSCNLDHVLYGIQNATDAEKESYAHSFSMKYGDDIDGFLRFIQSSELSAGDNYAQSWEFIKQDFHSLERHCNLGIAFQKADAEQHI